MWIVFNEAALCRHHSTPTHLSLEKDSQGIGLCSRQGRGLVAVSQRRKPLMLCGLVVEAPKLAQSIPEHGVAGRACEGVAGQL
jgi:hypothetical protein